MSETIPAAAPVADPPSCPACRSDMVCRRNHNTGNWFFGCSKFPVCRKTLPGTAYDPSTEYCYDDF